MRILSFTLRGVSFAAKGNACEKERLEGENHLLRFEIGKLRALLEQQEKIAALHQELKRVPLSSRRYDEMHYLLGLADQAVPARVIYRDPGSWSSSFWVNVGEETNRVLKRCVIQKNSPVVLGRSLVGTVDYVGKRQSRIRLITDVALKPSVRALRGHPQNKVLLEHLEPVLRQLSVRADLQLAGSERRALISALEKLREKVSEDKEGLYLAKGILQGAGTPLWRSFNHTLRGIGFNYDCADKEGPARELATGKPVDEDGMQNALPLLKVNDLLVTTGMDGVFPAGLRVAEVTKIYPLREGAYTYEIEATPVIGNLDTLQTVFIIPPLGYELGET